MRKTEFAIIQTKKTKNPRTIVWSENTHYYLMKYSAIRQEMQQSSNASALFIG